MGLFSRHKNTQDAPLPPTLSSVSSANSNNVAEQEAFNAPPVSDKSMGSLTAPPIPGGLDDIKEQVSPNSLDETPQSLDLGNEPTNDFSSDSLFDMFGEELPQENSTPETPSPEKPSAMDFQEDTTTDTNMSRSDSLNFMRNSRSYSHDSTKDSCFLTTNQFKTLLEIVEQVKSKVKDSTEVHLRLMDMKSEEDIEYENLRKNFQNIEDKLYELDNILFDK